MKKTRGKNTKVGSKTSAMTHERRLSVCLTHAVCAISILNMCLLWLDESLNGRKKNHNKGEQNYRLCNLKYILGGWKEAAETMSNVRSETKQRLETVINCDYITPSSRRVRHSWVYQALTLEIMWCKGAVCLTVTGSHQGAVAALFSRDWNSLGPLSRLVWREITVIESSHFALSPLWPRMDWYLFNSLPICGSVSTSHCFVMGHFFLLQRLNRTWDVKICHADIKICHFFLQYNMPFSAVNDCFANLCLWCG